MTKTRRDPFKTLDLPRDADERAVKRAYAQRLRRTRPDDDPVGFQALHEAYEAALQAVAYRREEEAETAAESAALEAEAAVVARETRRALVPAPGEHVPAAVHEHRAPVAGHASVPSLDDAPVPIATRAPHGGPEAGDDPAPASEDFAPLTFDFGEFMEELLRRMRRDRRNDVTAWLHARPELYSFQLKQAITMEVLRIAATQEPPLPDPTMDALVAFFGLNDIGPGGWWLRERVQKARERAERRERFARLPLPRTTRERVTWFDARIDDELVLPDSPVRTALVLAWPWTLPRIRARLQELDYLGGEVAAECMNPGRRELYMALSDPARPDRRRFALSGARTLAYGGVLVAIAALLSFDVVRATWFAGLAGAASLAILVLRAGWLQMTAAFTKRYGDLERELSCAVQLMVGTAVWLVSPLQSFAFWGSVGLMLAAVFRVVGVRRSLVALLMGGLWAAAEGLLRESTGLAGFGFGIPTLWALAASTLALDRFMAKRRGTSVRAEALDPGPMQKAFFGLFLLMLVAGGVALALTPAP